MNGPSDELVAHVAERIDWADGLLSLRLDRVAPEFEPGQYVQVTFEAQGVSLYLSLVCAPGQPFEVLVSALRRGSRAGPVLACRPGDRVRISHPPAGRFGLAEVAPAPVLWMLATGSGLAPMMSMLRSGAAWARWHRVVLVHGVRYPEHLAYADEIEAMARARPGRLTRVPVVSRSPDAPGVLHGRLTDLVANGGLERAIGERMTAERGQVLVCGNPEAVRRIVALLDVRGMHVQRPGRPGHVHVESYG